jgi:ergothioneine biosynthesis protein EgtB
MRTLIDRVGDDPAHPAYAIIELGLHHEQQHQELLLTDIKHVFWTNPLRPAYLPRPNTGGRVAPLAWHETPEGVYRIGHDRAGFAFDNEGPAHRVFVDAFGLGSRLITNGEFLSFMEDGGYRRPEWWLSTGWNIVQQARRRAPLYWDDADGGWTEFTLAGTHPIDGAAPVTHVSYFEADAFARWAGRRLPTEAEWEVAASGVAVDGSFVDARRFHPLPAEASAPGSPDLAQLYGDVWQWTQSAYVAYPGYAPAAGAIGEYNGKWMADQWVLRGASCATPRSHARATYRNFFPSDTRWQFTGIRLASDRPT